MKRTSAIYTAALIAATMAAVLSISIAVPLLWRGFYFLHIDALHLPERTGYTVQEIKDAFNEMMDYCMWGEPFGTGVMKWSQSGYDHFADCAKLFRMDLIAVGLSVGVLLILLVLHRRGFRTVDILGKGPMFWACGLLSGGFILIAGLAALDFDRAFVLFHTLFFPGKTNWIFDYRTDEIINVLPQVFFMNCAILIVSVLLVLCLTLLWAERVLRNKRKNPN